MEAKRNTLTRNQPRPPRDSLDFRVAIICALPLEASAVGELFDTQCTTKYAKVPGDSNAYSTGAIGPHNVVLVHMPNMGKVAAATAAAGLRATFPGIQLALVVGICGGVPSAKQSKRDILLGDVVISEGLVQYDFGRQYPDNRFLRKDSARDNLPRPRPDIRSVLAKLQTESGKDQLQEQTSEHLKVLQHRLSRGLVYPGASEDRLFRSGYQHRHHRYSQCDICANHGTCDESIDKDCQELGCSELELVSRTHQSLSFMPEVHLGLFASGDTVMKSGDARDEIATRDGVLAFEMEGAGIWEAFPTVLIIKGVCDYADSHKNKKWQAYAAATAASAAKAFLEDWRTGA
ncbi:purine and uridine phosphorylase [Aspergillus crustosus]